MTRFADDVPGPPRRRLHDTDIESKRTFSFLSILFSLAETGQSAVAPVVMVPSR